ncbi:hypothetical protein CLV92_1277 [Kineococcus xinjiangensis]|uniref:Secreted protein n=1 Tax=Kineococcus xinjiangensis TaxID=512762 RepID=A0A2S6IC04_9ACTN|nr:hypothetical protein [Kineococcus xinjiangensis]PPK90187.1 hypothetical protein CLV92_1277 [Kineococcus xinjiangensis]
MKIARRRALMLVSAVIASCAAAAGVAAGTTMPSDTITIPRELGDDMDDQAGEAPDVEDLSPEDDAAAIARFKQAAEEARRLEDDPDVAVSSYPTHDLAMPTSSSGTIYVVEEDLPAQDRQ